MSQKLEPARFMELVKGKLAQQIASSPCLAMSSHKLHKVTASATHSSLLGKELKGPPGEKSI